MKERGAVTGLMVLQLSKARAVIMYNVTVIAVTIMSDG
jgi:hypothetical protein